MSTRNKRRRIEQLEERMDPLGVMRGRPIDELNDRELEEYVAGLPSDPEMDEWLDSLPVDVLEELASSSDGRFREIAEKWGAPRKF